MRRVLRLMTDRSGLRSRWILRPVEAVSGRAHFASALLRPADTSDWDYANEAHRLWHNPDDPQLTSTDSFFDLYELARGGGGGYDYRLPRRPAHRPAHDRNHPGSGLLQRSSRPIRRLTRERTALRAARL